MTLGRSSISNFCADLMVHVHEVPEKLKRYSESLAKICSSVSTCMVNLVQITTVAQKSLVTS